MTAEAREVMGPGAYDYCAGGAGDEAAMVRNVAALDARVLTPRMLGGTPGEGALGVEVPGGRLVAPILVAPMGLQRLCHPEAERATAAAAAEVGLGHCLSMFSSETPERVAAGAGTGVRWQQIYLLRDREVTESVVRRATEAGYRALVVTVDVPVVGRRTRDMGNRFDRFRVAPPALCEDPRFVELLGARGEGASAERLIDELFPDPGSTWDDVARLVAGSSLPVLVKGVLCAGDAKLALDAGAAGVVVSNHGGRQFDRSVAAIEALGPVVDVCDRAGAPVFFDSGVRRASHIATALALGARAVLVGRPVLWALATGGQEEVRRVLAGLTADLAHLLAILGVPSVAALRGIPVTAPGGGP
ncbi:alpha-hydroxy acid oxidase [Sphaerisporangium aureirubrum]|uniref:Alpha-hydroxy acid oxidase n=1 Tax=Sphaerisporangium aureirubrum TaxID=1544736 RepID=A0ABW1NLB7_9ACTN